MRILAQVVLQDYCHRSHGMASEQSKKANPKKQHTAAFPTGEQISFHSFWDVLIHLALLRATSLRLVFGMFCSKL